MLSVLLNKTLPSLYNLTHLVLHFGSVTIPTKKNFYNNTINNDNNIIIINIIIIIIIF